MVVSAWLCLAYFSWHTHTANMTSSRQIKPHFYLHRNFCAPYRELKNLPMIPDCGWAKEGSCNCQALVWILLYYLTFYFILYLPVLISNFWIWIWHCTVWLLVTCYLTELDFAVLHTLQVELILCSTWSWSSVSVNWMWA